MKRNVVKTIVLSVIMIALVLFSTTTLAASNYDPSQYTGEGATIDSSRVGSFGNNIVSVITTAGSVLSVIVLVVLGIKYMMGSAEEKAEYKKTLLPYFIGAILVFAASTIASIIFSVANGAWG